MGRLRAAEPARFWVPVALGLTMLCGLTILVEVVPRLVDLPAQLAMQRTVSSGLYLLDAAAGYVMRPGYQGRWSTTEFDQTFHVNARGLRGPDLNAKHPGEFRVVVIGDSMVFAGQVAENQRFTERLEATLSGRGFPHVRVINVGVPGWTTFNEAGYLQVNQEWLEPDLVVLAVYLGNDIPENVLATIGGYAFDHATGGIAYGQRAREVVRNSVEWFPHNFEVDAANYAPPHVEPSDWRFPDPLPQPVRNAPPGPPNTPAPSAKALAYTPSSSLDAARTWLKKNSRMYVGLSSGWFYLRHGYAPPTPLSLDRWLAFALRDEPQQYWIQVGYPLTEQYLAQAHQASMTAGARFLALLIPHDAQVDDAKARAELGRFQLAPHQIDLDRPRRELLQRAARQGIEKIDLLPSLRARPDRAELTYRHDLHFTPLGHAVVAETLADELIARCERFKSAPRSAQLEPESRANL